MSSYFKEREKTLCSISGGSAPFLNWSIQGKGFKVFMRSQGIGNNVQAVHFTGILFLISNTDRYFQPINIGYQLLNWL
jgi:hypothetical protein